MYDHCRRINALSQKATDESYGRDTYWQYAKNCAYSLRGVLNRLQKPADCYADLSGMSDRLDNSKITKIQSSSISPDDRTIERLSPYQLVKISEEFDKSEEEVRKNTYTNADATSSADNG